MSIYGRLAAVYDAFTADQDPVKWCDTYLALMEKTSFTGKTIADIGCGTGRMSIALSKRGFNIIGIDRSADMLEVAAQKARQSGVRVPFVCQDMRCFTLHKPVDRVICACDGVNYLLGEQDVRQFFQAAHAALKPGGGFAFDISSIHKLSNILGNGFFAEEREDMAYIWQNRFEKDMSTMAITFFVRRQDGLYERFEETHVQRAYEPKLLRALLEQAGFEAVAFTDEDREEDADRIFFTARKPA